MTESRGRRERSSLGADEILAASERVAEEGFEALTMRAVASELRSAPMSLYRYFPTKDDLVAALLDRVLQRVALDPPTTDWANDLERFARAHRRVLSDHPWAIRALFARPDPGPGAALVAEHALAILARGGRTGRDAVAGFSAILALNYGWAAFDSPDRTEQEILDGMLGLPAEHFPHTRAVAEPLSQYSSDDNYSRALRITIDGITGAV